MTDVCSGCGEKHLSNMAMIYCLEQMESDTIAARKKPKPHRPNAYIRSID